MDQDNKYDFLEKQNKNPHKGKNISKSQFLISRFYR